MPINRRHITLLESTGTAMNTYSTEVKADSYYGYTDGLHTLQVTYADYVGKVRIQGTLSLTPTSTDWFDILPISVSGTAFTSDSTGIYVEFGADPNWANGSEAYTVQGNFAWLRVYMDRETVGDGSTYLGTYGQVTRVILST